MSLHPVEASELHARRERVFLLLSGLFLGSLTMLNILGITRFIDMSFELAGLKIPFVVAVGVLPYPLTFLATDLISELYGEKRANAVVWMGLLLNLWVVFILWVGGALPGYEAVDANGDLVRAAAGAIQHIAAEQGITEAQVLERYPELASLNRPPLFFEIRSLAFGAVAASMIAYMAAQFCDVYMFHFWKRLTRGKHLWLRNNGSTMVSQLVDSTAVILITHFYAHALPVKAEEPIWPQLLTFIASGYVFKFVVAALDTGPVYLCVHWLSRYLELDPNAEFSEP